MSFIISQDEKAMGKAEEDSINLFRGTDHVKNWSHNWRRCGNEHCPTAYTPSEICHECYTKAYPEDNI